MQTGVVSVHHSGWVDKERVGHPQLSKHPPPCQLCPREGLCTKHVSVGDVVRDSGAEGDSHGACSAVTRHGGHPSLVPHPPLPHPHRLGVITSAPHPTMEKLHLAVPSSVGARALNANTSVIV